MLGTFGILLGFGILTFGAWKKINLIGIALLTAGVIGYLNGFSVIETWEGPFLEGFTGFAASFILIFCAGALFGKLMEDSGAAWRLGETVILKAGEKWALPAYIGVTGLMLYGGVSIFVIIFVLLPIAKTLFERGRIPWYLFPATTIFAGGFPCVMIPGGLQVYNFIASDYFGTPLTAAPLAGILATITAITLGGLYIRWEIKKGRVNLDSPDGRPLLSEDELDIKTLDEKAPSFIVSLIPIITALLSINLLKLNVLYGLLLTCLVCLVLFRKSLKDIKKTINDGISNGVLPVVMVAVVVGVAKTVAVTSTFEIFRDWLMTLQIGGLFKVVTVTSSLAAITGSATGSLTMVLEMFGEEFLSWGYSPDILHRLIVTASIGLDSLPWNSFVVLLFTLSATTYAKGYRAVFVLSVLLPLICTLPIILVGSI